MASKAVKSTKGKGKAPQRSPKAPKPPSPRTSSSNSSSGASEGDEEADDDQAAMLAALQAHSRAMFGLDGPEQAESSTQAQRRFSSRDLEDEGDEFQSDDGWGANDEFVSDSEDEDVDDEDDESGPEQELPRLAEPARSRVVEVVDASTAHGGSLDILSKAEKRAFLNGNSAKMMGIKREADYIPAREQKRLRTQTEGGDDDDHDKLKLDKTLHEMLLSNLLSTATTDAAQRPVDKRNAIQGRILELASYSIPGEGSKSAHESNSRLSAHPAKIRTGIIHAQAKRDAQAREEARAAGNKGLGESHKRKDEGKRDRAVMGADLGKKKGMAGRTKGDAARDRGLTMGVGRFSNGALKLSESEIARGTAEPRDSGRGGRGGRGRGGGGRGRGRGGGGGGGGRGGGGGKRGKR